MAAPKKNTAYNFTTELVSQANVLLFQVNPTLATGDWKSSQDFGAFNNLATLPTVTPSSGRQVKVALSAGEMNADDVGVEGVDAAGAEWCDVGFHFSLNVRNADDLAYPATSGRSTLVNSDGTVQADVRELLGTSWLTPAVAGAPDIGNVSGKVLGAGAGVISGAGVWAFRHDGTQIPKIRAAQNVTLLQQFPMRLTNGNAATGVTVTVQCSIDGGAYANCAGGSPAGQAAEVSGGDYKIQLAAADRNGSRIMYRATAAGCNPTEFEIDSDG